MKRSMLALMITLSMAVVISLGVSTLPQPAQSGKPIALVGGTLIDGFGGPPIRNSVVLVRGERIAAVGQVGALAVPADFEVISTEGMSVLPGLWDMHVHLMINGHSDYTHWDKTYPARQEKEIMPASARQLLMAGVTSARDLGGPLEPSLHVRDAINRGEIPGATMYVSGPFLQHEPYPGTELFRWGLNGPADARAKVKKLADAGVDVDQAHRSGSDDGRRGQRRHRRSAQAQPAGDRARASARGDPARAEVRRGRSAAHGPGDRAGVSGGHHRGHQGAHGEDVARTAVVDADGRRPLQLRVHARQPGDARRSVVDAGPRRRTSSRTSASRSSIRGR